MNNFNGDCIHIHITSVGAHCRHDAFSAPLLGFSFNLGSHPTARTLENASTALAGRCGGSSSGDLL